MLHGMFGLVVEVAQSVLIEKLVGTLPGHPEDTSRNGPVPFRAFEGEQNVGLCPSRHSIRHLAETLFTSPDKMMVGNQKFG